MTFFNITNAKWTKMEIYKESVNYIIEELCILTRLM